MASETNYTWEMLASEPSQTVAGVWAFLALVATFFLGFWALPIFAAIYVGVAGITAMFLPESLLFRAWVDKGKRAAQRETIRTRLLARIEENRPRGEHDRHGRWAPNEAASQHDNRISDYQRMVNRLQSLKDLAGDPRNPISGSDIERLDDATIDFLRLLHTQLALQKRVTSGDGEDRVRTQLASVDQQLRGDLGGAERKRLEKSKAELQSLQEQRKRLPGQLAATEAQLTTMSEAFEEVYHRITANPQGATTSAYLEEASSRLAIEEEITMSVEEEMGQLSDLSKYRAARAASTKVHQ